MAFIQCQFHSDVLGQASSMNVLVPQPSRTQIGMDSASSARKDYPVLYLLHGLTDDHTIWMRRSAIERYAAQYEVVVVMPNVDRSFYTDMKYGRRYWTMISEELPAIVRNLFPVSSKPQDTYAAGLSMGGYGALKLGLRCPEKFAAIAALSPVTDICKRFVPPKPTDYHDNKEMEMIFGDAKTAIEQDNELFSLAEKTVQKAVKPRIYQVCGTEDPLYEENIRFRDHLRNLQYAPYEYHEGPGMHNWAFWDIWIQDVLRFMFGK